MVPEKRKVFLKNLLKQNELIEKELIRADKFARRVANFS